MPLSDLCVIEFAGVLAGPLVGQFCAELGADVIKVEPPGRGDPTRTWYLPTEDRSSDVSAYFACANRGKRSIAVDLGTPEGRALAHELVRRADVVVTSFKPGDDRHLGLDAATLRGLNERVVHVQVTAYGAGDPRPGFDAVIQAEAGLTYLNGEPDGPALKMPVALVDVLTAHQLKEGLLLALLGRSRTGRGVTVSASLLASATASLANQASNYLFAGTIPQPMGSAHPNIAPYGTAYTTRDGRSVVLAVGTDRQFQALADALGLTELAADPKYASNAERVRHRDELESRLRERTACRDASTLGDELRRAGVPFGFVNDMAQVFQQAESRRQLFDDGRGVRTVALSGEIEGRRELGPAPHLDQHGDELRRWLG